MKVEKKVHPIWKELEKKGLKKGLSKPDKIIGKWQYIYSSSKGEISLVSLPNYFGDGITLWEIYALKGDLRAADVIERFKNKEEAEKRIRELLE